MNYCFLGILCLLREMMIKIGSAVRFVRHKVFDSRELLLKTKRKDEEEKKITDDSNRPTNDLLYRLNNGFFATNAMEFFFMRILKPILLYNWLTIDLYADFISIQRVPFIRCKAIDFKLYWVKI